MTNREKYHAGRRKLLAEMGGSCPCGETDFDKLEFHHKYGRDWEPCKTSRWVRLARYRREWVAGLIELRCSTCNKKFGKPRYVQPEAGLDGVPF